MMHLSVLILPKLAVPKELLTLSASFGESVGVSRATELWSPHSGSFCVWLPRWPCSSCVGSWVTARVPSSLCRQGREQVGAGLPQQSACSFSQLLLPWLPSCHIIPSGFEVGEKTGAAEDQNLCGIRHLSWGTWSKIAEIFQENGSFLMIEDYSLSV